MQRKYKIESGLANLGSYIESLNNECYQPDLEYAQRAAQANATPDDLVNLFMRIQMHVNSLDKKIGTGVFGGLFGASLMVTAGFSFFYSMGFSTPVTGGIFTFGAGLLGTSIGVPITNSQKDSKIAFMQKYILNHVYKRFLNEKKYDVYTIATLITMKKLAEKAKESQFETIQVDHCIEQQIPSKKSDDLYAICFTLADNLLFNLIRENSKMVPGIKQLIDSLCHEMLKQNHFGDYIKIKLTIILNTAQFRDETARDPDRATRNQAITDVINKMILSSTPDDIQAALQYAINEARSESKTSITAKDMETLGRKFQQEMEKQEAKRSRTAMNAKNGQSSNTQLKSFPRI